MSKNTLIVSGLFAACVCLPFAQRGRAQTLQATLESVSCTSAVVLVPTTTTVDIYDGTTQIATNVPVTGSTSPTTLPLGTLPTSGPFHVLSVSLHGAGQDLQGSPQSIECGSSTQYTYNYTSSTTFSTSFTPTSSMTINGGYSVASGLLASQAYPGTPFSLIYNTTIPNPLNSGEWPNEFETNSTIQLAGAGGSYVHYVMAQTSAVQGLSGASNSKQYYAVELYNPTFDSGGNCTATLNFWQNTAAASTATEVSSVTVPCSTTTLMRTVAFYLPGSGLWKIWALINNYLYSYSITPGGTPQYPHGQPHGYLSRHRRRPDTVRLRFFAGAVWPAITDHDDTYSSDDSRPCRISERD